MRRTIAVLLMLCVGWARAAGDAPSEFLDERTGATITVVAKPLIFSRRSSTFSSNDRDYTNLVAVQVDRSGQLQLYLVGYNWTRVDPRGKDKPDAAAGIVELMADDQPLRFTPADSFPADLQDRKRLFDPGSSLFQRFAYPVTVESLRRIAASKNLVLRFDAASAPADAPAGDYEIWQDGRQALNGFLDRINPGSPPP